MAVSCPTRLQVFHILQLWWTQPTSNSLFSGTFLDTAHYTIFWRVTEGFAYIVSLESAFISGGVIRGGLFIGFSSIWVTLPRQIYFFLHPGRDFVAEGFICDGSGKHLVLANHSRNSSESGQEAPALRCRGSRRKASRRSRINSSLYGGELRAPYRWGDEAYDKSCIGGSGNYAQWPHGFLAAFETAMPNGYFLLEYRTLCNIVIFYGTRAILVIQTVLSFARRKLAERAMCHSG